MRPSELVHLCKQTPEGTPDTSHWWARFLYRVHWLANTGCDCCDRSRLFYFGFLVGTLPDLIGWIWNGTHTWLVVISVGLWLVFLAGGAISVYRAAEAEKTKETEK